MEGREGQGSSYTRGAKRQVQQAWAKCAEGRWKIEDFGKVSASNTREGEVTGAKQSLKGRREV